MYRPTGVAEASQILSKNNPFLIYYDPDIDGAVSGDFFRRVLTAFSKPFVYYINENRQHGFKMTQDQIAKLKGYTIILVDAAMTKQEIIMLTQNGIDIINIDHHHMNEVDFVYHKDPTTGCEGVIINNQYPFEPEEYRFLSGAGVVYYVINMLFPDFCGQDEKALVGLSLLSDIRPIENPIAQDFLHVTYTHKSPLIEYLIQLTKPKTDFGFGIQTFDRNFIDFTFSPKINALFRLNKGHDAVEVFSGAYHNTGQLDVYRNIQNSISEAIIQNLQGEEYSNLTFKYVDSNLSLPYAYDVTNFIGLACSRVKNDGKTSVLFVRENGVIKRGSLRGLCDDVDYLSILRKHGFDAEGHKNAFGVKSVDFSKVDLVALNEEIRQAEHGYEERKYRNRILPVNNLSFFLQSKEVKIADYNNYVRDPSRLFIKYTGSNIERHKRGKVIDFTLDGVQVLCFDEDLTVENSLILPVKERGNYVQFYMKRY